MRNSSSSGMNRKCGGESCLLVRLKHGFNNSEVFCEKAD